MFDSNILTRINTLHRFSNWASSLQVSHKMLSRSLRKSVLDSKISTAILPPTFLLPIRARYFNSTAQIIDSPTDSLNVSEDPPSGNVVAASPPILDASKNLPTEPMRSTEPPKPLSESVKSLLPLLRGQPSHFITAHIHARPYLLTTGDTVRLPFHMPGVAPGDVLRLTRASAIGSRDYTLKGAPYVDERIFECRATVMGTEGEPVRVKTKTKRRNRRVRTVRSKHKFTVLRLTELRVKGLEEIES
jgi:large subunit ribosomal protein L21